MKVSEVVREVQNLWKSGRAPDEPFLCVRNLTDCYSRCEITSWLVGVSTMDRDGKQEKWMELCAQAAKEQDSQKLLALVDEINRLLEAKEPKPPVSQTKA
jgi:hypothetical protein